MPSNPQNNIPKKRIDWEEIEIKELFEVFQPSDEFPEGKEHSMLEEIISRYIEKGTILRVLHTNFNLSLHLLKRISEIEGVETLVPIGRYRAIINFGRLFEIEEIKRNVKAELNKSLYPKKLRKEDEEEGGGGVP